MFFVFCSRFFSSQEPGLSNSTPTGDGGEEEREVMERSRRGKDKQLKRQMETVKRGDMQAHTGVRALE